MSLRTLKRKSRWASRISLTAVLVMGLLSQGCLGKGLTRKKLGEDYTTKYGTLVGPPHTDDGGKRLFLVLKVEENVEEKVYIIKCAVRNDKEERILQGVKARLATNDPVYIFGRPLDEQWEEFPESIDFEMVAIGIFDPHKEDWEIIMLTYGTSTMDAIRSAGWGTFIMGVGKAAFKELKP
jgi:hypothetical protein